MEISFLTPHMDIVGGNRRIIELSNQLVKKGHRVTIYHPTGERCRWLECLASFKKLEELLRQEHQVLIYTFPPLFPYFARARAQLKVYYILHNEALKKGYDRELCIRTYKQENILKIANSTWTANQIKKVTGEIVPVVHGGINRSHFHPVSGRKKEVDVIFYGSKRYYKGTDTILEACRIGGFTHDHYEGKGLCQDQMADFICKGRVFVSGSYFEGWNHCVLEAMACRVPVVTTACGGINDFVIDGVNALVVEPKNPAAMAAKIKLLLDNPALAEKLARKGYEKSLEFTWGKSAEQLEKLLTANLSKGLNGRTDMVRLVTPKSTAAY